MTTLVINHGAAKTPAAQASAKPGPAAPLVTPQVSVDGVVIPSKAIAAEVQNFPSRNPGEGWLAAARALVIRELLLQEARRLNIVAEPKTDVDGREDVWAWLHRERDRGASVIVVSHREADRDACDAWFTIEDRRLVRV